MAVCKRSSRVLSAVAIGLLLLGSLGYLVFPYLEVANTYFISGTFDPVDVLFILFGTAAALLTLYKVQR